ncbi:RNA-directed DNA polymerase [uncultured Thiothrix sp.]|uniref:RNA-directed DNA polymerase n=1 Tax=uncultured Thiothrix sp. TaxID=223185 RepID=UPI00263253A0|nr:RNA-directed DNA polymerase [uncultured Thiothrix sp.]HMT94198.1 reverse transcriptase domain-containing protein [Thiolinea sp.]
MSAYKYFNNQFKATSLKQIYHNHIESNTAVGLDKIGRDKFRQECDNHIEIINRKVHNNTYNFTPYKKKLISKGENKNPRVISIPTFRDRITLRAICNILAAVYKDLLNIEIPQIKIESINKNIKKKKYDKYIKIDVSNFYPSINHETLLKILKRKIRKPELIDLINKAIKNTTVTKAKNEKDEENKSGVPQGLSISNILAEIYLLDIDNKYKQNKKIFYTRYVDDILMFCKEKDCDKIFDDIKNDFQKTNLGIHELNKKNSKCQSGDINDELHYLGYKYKNRKSTIIENNKQKFEDSIANLLTTFKYKYDQATKPDAKNSSIDVLEWRLNLRITGCIFEGKKRGWMFYFSQIEDLTPIYSIDQTITKLVTRVCPKSIHIKKLIKTYHETKRLKVNSHKYITNFDILSVADKRKILTRYLGYKRLSKVDDETINKYFGMRITHIIQELEQDIGDIS